MREKKLLFVFSFVAQIALSFNLVYANNTYFTASPISYSVDSEISPYANVTGYKYMEIDGIKYKRLWSYTYSRWEEPYWTVA